MDDGLFSEHGFAFRWVCFLLAVLSPAGGHKCSRGERLKVGVGGSRARRVHATFAMVER